MLDSRNLSELIAGIQHEVQKSLEYTKFATEERNGPSVSMSMTDLEVEVPISMVEDDFEVDMDVLAEAYEELEPGQRAEAWLKLPTLEASAQHAIDVSSTIGGPLKFDRERAAHLNEVLLKAVAKPGAAIAKPPRDAAGRFTPRQDRPVQAQRSNVVQAKRLAARAVDGKDASNVDSPLNQAKLKISFKAALQ